MGSELMKSRVIRVPDAVWQAAKKRADEKGETVSEAVRKFLERYGAMSNQQQTIFDTADLDNHHGPLHQRRLGFFIDHGINPGAILGGADSVYVTKVDDRAVISFSRVALPDGVDQWSNNGIPIAAIENARERAYQDVVTAPWEEIAK